MGRATNALASGARRARSRVKSYSRGLTLDQLYLFQGLAYVLALLPAAFAPMRTAVLLYGSLAEPAEDQHAHTLGLLSTGFLLIACIFFTLEEGTRRRVNATPEQELLRDGVLVFTALSFLSHLLNVGAFTVLGGLAMLLAQLSTILLLWSSSRAKLPRSAAAAERRARAGARQAMRLPHGSILGHIYLGLAIASPLLGVTAALLPKLSMYHALGYVYGRSTLLPWRQWGLASSTLVPAIALFLKDKAEKGRLGRSTSRILNAGLFGANLGELMVFAPILAARHGGALLPVLVAKAGVACLTAVLGFTAPEIEEFAEQLVEHTSEEEDVAAAE